MKISVSITYTNIRTFKVNLSTENHWEVNSQSRKFTEEDNFWQANNSYFGVNFWNLVCIVCNVCNMYVEYAKYAEHIYLVNAEYVDNVKYTEYVV